MNTVLILGANGRFGQAAVTAFATAGWRVLAQVRRAPAAALPAGARALSVPLDTPEALAQAAAGATVVVHAVNPLYTRWRTEALPALQQGLAVARALDACFLLPGNVYNYGTQLQALLREDTPQHPDHEKARIRVDMEAAVRDAALAAEREGRAMRGIVIRAGDFYGCGSGSWLDQAIVKDLRQGKLVYPGPLDRPHAWAYLPDLAQAFVRVAHAAAGPRFETLHFAGHTLTGQQLTDALKIAAHELGIQPPGGFTVAGMPWGFIRAVGTVYPLWRELARMHYLWDRPHTLDGTRLAIRAALPPGTPVAAALLQSLKDLGFAAAAGPARSAPQGA